MLAELTPLSINVSPYSQKFTPLKLTKNDNNLKTGGFGELKHETELSSPVVIS